ncbi:WD40 repeat-like protein [Daedalea quercina L-15889]|uniref:WD40 repeat-like protein n=1 Tax=Daedalea quercina L-15889 TaxID=1314783 RepID=A0A165PXD7_9APHY|nr:WD40 repeat-like protein [Daedalea quercina L-15889]
MARGRESRTPHLPHWARGLLPQRRSSSARASGSRNPTSTSDPKRNASQTSLPHFNLVSNQALTPTGNPPHASSPVGLSPSGQPLSSSPANQATATVEDPSSVLSTGLAAFKLVLSLVKEVSDPIPVAGSALSAAAGGLLTILESVEQARDAQEDFEAAANKIGKLLEVLTKYQSQPSKCPDEMQECVGDIVPKMNELRAALEKKWERPRLRRMFSASADSGEVVRCLRKIGDAVELFLVRINVNQDAKLDTLISGGVNQGGKLDNIISDSVTQGEKLDGVLQASLLEKLYPVRSARHDAMDIPSCLETTRVQLLDDILTWAAPREGKDAPPVFFLSGMAGSGKSTVAKSVCAKLQDMGILGASFFCSRRSTAEQRDVRSIFRTLAYLLSLHSPKFARQVCEALKNDPDAATTVPKEQFRMLIDTPAKAAFATAEPTPIIVIDAVDECDGADATYELLEIILREAPQLHLKFLVTSRPEARIRDVFGKPGSTALRLQDIESHVVNADIDKYLTSTLSGIENNWPSSNDINTLLSRSHGLFIYAATACKYVTYHSGDRRERLQKLVSPHGRPLADMEQMYDLILDQGQLNLDDEEINAVRRCLTAVACVRDPLSVHDFAHFLNLTPRKVRIAFAALHSVVDVPESDDGLLTTYHASFPEYLISGARSASKVADPKLMHYEFFDKCLEIMKSGLFFNVSGCSTSYATNTKQLRSHSDLSLCLRYACRFFVDHLTISSCSVNITAEKVSSFLRDQFLYWVEALSASGHAGTASSLVMKLVVWFRAQASADMTESVAACLQLLLDANQFLVRFRTPILESAPHIYLSALAFAPPDSEIARAWQDRLERRLVVHTKQQLEAIPLLRLHGHESEVLLAAFSADGRRIVSASKDGIIRFWDSGTGDAIGQPVQGPIHHVFSVAFSPDWTRVVSTSLKRSNNSLLIWDVETGHTVGHPLEGHTARVNLIAFSPNGELIASASDDGTIRVWDVRPGMGAPASRPPMIHGERVISVAFSPDGGRIASGSQDGTIWVWNTEICDIIWEQCLGHKGWVRSVTFSADGQHIVSASRDKTIRVWNAEAGGMIGQELRGHTGSVESAVFSPNGKLIASSSYDTTIHVWNVESGCGLQVLKGHTNSVSFTTFSPDGNLIASASHDGTICIWDALTTSKAIQPLKRHTDWVQSIMFTPDGRHIQVPPGSSNKTIHIWDSEAGTTAGLPSEGHEGDVRSAMFSPDGLNITSNDNLKTIHLCDVVTGSPIQPFTGHSHRVLSVALSPDGRHIASGLGHRTIRIWDAQTGTVIREPFKGHGKAVTSITYSPDGRLIASGSRDKTIRVWNAETGASVGQPFKGHTDRVTSVAFSPDGAKIVSGSRDRTIRIWDPQTGTTVGQPLEGHEGKVNSVDFLPDGRHVISVSYDNKLKKIHVWDVETCTMIGMPFTLDRHKWETSIRIACGPGSHDMMIDIKGVGTRSVWDARASSSDMDETQHNAGSTGSPLHKARTVAFSSNPEHAYNLGTLGDFSQPKVLFEMNNDGWIQVSPGWKYFLWIPPEYRPGLWWPGTTVILGTHPVHLDLSQFTHGTAWTECWCSDDHLGTAR